MNRTERLYALVEELRAVAPRPRTVAWLAERFEVSRRTVQRDLQALLQAGVPVRDQPGPYGGWFVDPVMTLPPINLTAEEALALAAAVAAAENTTPFAAAARGAMAKLATAMSAGAAEQAAEASRRIFVLPRSGAETAREAVARAVLERRVIRLTYADAAGEETVREVEPAALLTARGHWYLVGYCRMRRAGRGFRLDRVRHAEVTAEAAPARELAALDPALAIATYAESLESFTNRS